VDLVADPLLLRKTGSAENRTRTFGSVARNSDHLITEAVEFFFKKENFLKSLAVNVAFGNVRVYQ
jgi:hypothetical protein